METKKNDSKSTSKQTRKYKDKVKEKKKAKKPKEKMFKVLIDRANFVGPFPESEARDYIEAVKERATKEHREPPSMSLVPQK